MVKRDSFLLRIDPLVLEAIRRWSDDELRSMNAQIEFLLKKALRDAGRSSCKTDSTQKQSKKASPETGTTTD